MKRRDFVKIGSLASLPILLKSCDWVSETNTFPVTVMTDIHTGHLVFESRSFPKSQGIQTDIVIVGGGIAGISAAYQLRNQNFTLFELSDDLGGTSSSFMHNGIPLCQGAHYDLAYPDYYGQEGLNLLQELGLIEYQSWNKLWSFKDKDYLIPPRRESRCFANGKFRNEVLPEGELSDQFYELMERYVGDMPMPTTEINEELRKLNEQTFEEFLEERLNLNDKFIEALDYHMLDDWGGKTDKVSALAGIHYFACRPYETQVVDLFSPPQGNAYFIEKLSEQLPQKHIKVRHLVKSIKEHEGKLHLEVVDIENQSVEDVKADKVIYAGQKHALKYIMPEQYPSFEHVEYAPWLVINLVLNEDFNQKGFWQNEMLVEDETFLGFVDSDMQHHKSDANRVLTAYYCLPSASREDLRNVEDNKEQIIAKTLRYISDYFNEDMSKYVEAAYIKVMGHAMPVPKPGYLFKDANQNRLYPNMTFAGVDNGRLPLFFEALDSGIQAAYLLGK